MRSIIALKIQIVLKTNNLRWIFVFKTRMRSTARSCAVNLVIPGNNEIIHPGMEIPFGITHTIILPYSTVQ